MVYHIVYLPSDLQQALSFGPAGRLRVEVEIGEYGWKGAFTPAGDGRHYLLVNKTCLKSNRLKFGSPVEVSFRIDDPDRVVVPPELERALEENGQAARAWDGLTAGHRRGLCYRVDSARRPLTRVSRVAEVMAFLKGQGPDPSKPARR